MGKGFRLVTSLLLLSFLSSGIKASSEPIAEEKDITTPLATNPSTTTPTTVVPNSDSDAAVATTPLTIPSPPHAAAHPGGSWCVARENVAKMALQAALDYACGIGGAECSEIQEGGKCYNPNSLRAHASFAFNSYYQKNPIPSSCNFDGTAVTISADPSIGSCHFPSTSTSESILNVSTEDGLGLFGRIPSHPTPKPEASVSSSKTLSFLYFYSLLLCFCFYIFLL
ncbi:PREDICTED: PLASMODESMATA CALLOSE-BINDING PROTEIN 5-like [Camelina sativa]|uniref:PLASMODESMATA CALLOSE-BINDING PROTEIN 5-like n=1 Tax=Camelina sativa TaxID=90675 RepID=A0ABM0Z4E0_CAMSA|nr:PREDICTED: PLASMODESMATA CALLOSE-BINDING PROTEIN 5-like [Camelina sativa]